MRLFPIYILFLMTVGLRAQQCLIQGSIVESGSQKAVAGVIVKVSNSTYTTRSDQRGQFRLLLPKKEIYKILFSHISYQNLSRELKPAGSDSLFIFVELIAKPSVLDTVAVFASHKPETLVAKPNYSIFDFDFYEDKLLLLAAERSLSSASVQLSDYNGSIYASYKLPKQAGEAQRFFHDYEGYSDIICKDSVFRIDVANNRLLMMPILNKDFGQYLLPVADTLNNFYYYSDNWENYPQFNYYYLRRHDSVNHLLNTVSNADLMKLYNLEYYYLPSRQQLEARRLADYYKTDVHIVAALMSGFTQSLFYEPLYAPLFILNDTICIFNHHNDHLYHYSKQNELIDSVRISYNHPKNWREWKKKLIVDETENKVYAFFSRDGHHYLKNINYRNGKEEGTYKLKYHSAEKIKIKDGFVYYVYRPFESTQEKFLYREKIEYGK